MYGTITLCGRPFQAHSIKTLIFLPYPKIMVFGPNFGIRHFQDKSWICPHPKVSLQKEYVYLATLFIQRP